MVKTTFADPTEGEGDGQNDKLIRKIQEQLAIVSALTAEDMTRQLLDPMAAMLIVQPDPAHQLRLAEAYASLAQAYIIKDAILSLKTTTDGKKDSRES